MAAERVSRRQPYLSPRPHLQRRSFPLRQVDPRGGGFSACSRPERWLWGLARPMLPFLRRQQFTNAWRPPGLCFVPEGSERRIDDAKSPEVDEHIRGWVAGGGASRGPRVGQPCPRR